MDGKHTQHRREPVKKCQSPHLWDKLHKDVDILLKVPAVRAVVHWGGEERERERKDIRVKFAYGSLYVQPEPAAEEVPILTHD